MQVKRFTSIVFAFLVVLGLQVSAITIGPGPVIGTDKRGQIWYEQFQDWASSDLRALDRNADQYTFGDANDTSRDIVAFYSHDDGTNVYFRFDFFDSGLGVENSDLDVYVAIDCATGGEEWLPDYCDTKTDHPWEICVGVYNSAAQHLYHTDWLDYSGTEFVASHWNSDLDSMEFAITREALTGVGWDGSSPLHLQPFTCRDGTESGDGNIDSKASDVVDHVGTLVRGTSTSNGWYLGGVDTSDSTGRAKYAVIAHANQSVNTKSGTQGHIYTDRGDINLYPGFIRMLDSAEMLDAPINLHLSGTLLISMLWARQDPAETGYPDRDGPTFVGRVKDFVTTGPGSLIGGVLAEHIMPYYEGEVNQKSIEQNSELLEELFSLTEADMKVMHTPERVIRSDTNSPYISHSGPLDGKTFEDIESSGFDATYLDEVTHLHWWFYQNETTNSGWDDGNWGRWAGGQGNDEEPYHHKVHKINGVYCFMINDREDQSKFGNDDSGMQHDTRYTLLDKALNPDSSQLTLVFDDWEAFAGNSFASPDPNNNADQWHNTLRWAANHQWIELVNLKDILTWATNDASWVIDHGYVYDKTSQTYEWLKRAVEHDYDHWYYGFTNTSSEELEESFYGRVPVVHDGWSPGGMKIYGDLNATGTLMRDSWDTIQSITSTNLKRLSEWAYSAMIYETAWHDENEPEWWSSGSWADSYQSRNYQTTFDRAETGSYEDGAPKDWTSGWALRLHGHVRDMGVMKEASDWVEDVKNGTQTATPLVYSKDIDDDTLEEYILCNDKVFACFERWGARLVKAFVFDPTLNGGDAIEVIGAPIVNPAEESENEGADNNRCSAFKDRYSTLQGNSYADMDFAYPTTPVGGSNFWIFTSADTNIVKKISIAHGRDVLMAEYNVTPDAGTIYSRHGIGPNQMDIVFHGHDNLIEHFDGSYTGIENTQGGGAYVVFGRNVGLIATNISNAGWEARELALTEQFETYNTDTNFTLAIAFSRASAMDLDGDGLSNTNEAAIGTDHEKPDSDGDYIPDGYEVANNLSPTSDDGAGDKDSDGVSNYGEYIGNTGADDSNSFICISDLVMSPTEARIESVTTPERTFEILYADSEGGFSDNMEWKLFNSSSVGTWLETNEAETAHTFVDDFGASTSDDPPTNGFRVYRIRVSIP